MALVSAPEHVRLAYQAYQEKSRLAKARGDLMLASRRAGQAHEIAAKALARGMWIPGMPREAIFKSMGAASWRPVGDGSKVGLFVPLPTVLAAQLPDLAPHDMSPSHVTFLQIGNVPQAKMARLLEICQAILGQSALYRSPARSLGLGEFGVQGGGVAAHLRILVPEALRQLRHQLVVALEASGFPVADFCPDSWAWEPHVTLAYLEPGEPFRGAVPRLEWTMDRIEMWGAPTHRIWQMRDPDARQVHLLADLARLRASRLEAEGLAVNEQAIDVWVDGPEMEVSGALARLLWEQQQGLIRKGWFAKGVGHKYIRRVPYINAKGKRRYRYYYKVSGGKGLAHEEELVVGAAFKIKSGVKEGHFHITKVEGDKITVEHDESGHTQTMTREHLAAMLRRYHAEAIADHKASTLKNLDDAKKHGSQKQQQRWQALALKYGYVEAFAHYDSHEPPRPFDYGPDKPPNWKHLNAKGIDLVRRKEGKWWRGYMDMSNPTLRAMGFYGVLSSFQLSFLLSNQGKDLTDKQISIMDEVTDRLDLWWSNLTDAQRDVFAQLYVDHEKQGGMAAVAVADAPETDEVWGASDVLEIPKGMEKMAAAGYKPHAYQARAVNFLTGRAGGKALWAMEMGLGKTLSALLAYHKLKQDGKADKMIVCAPINALGSWRQHLEKFSDARWAIVTGSVKSRQALYDSYNRGELDVLVITTDAVSNDEQRIKDAIGSREALGRTFRVIDEVHKFKNPKAKRTVAMRDLLGGDNPGTMVGMTGTVKPNKGEDFYHICENVKPGALGRNVWSFAGKYCYIEQGYKKTIGGFRKDAESALRNDTKDFIFSRTTSDADVNLALPKRHDVVEQLLNDSECGSFQSYLSKAFEMYRDGYDETLKPLEKFITGESSTYGLSDLDVAAVRAAVVARRDLEQKRNSAKGLEAIAYSEAVIPRNALGLMLRMRQLAVDPRVVHHEVSKHLKASYESPKIEYCADELVAHLENHPDKGGVVFGEFKEGLDVFKRAIEARGIDPAQIGYIDGSTPNDKREKLCDDLNQGRIKVLVAQRKSMQEGANLQHRANLVIHIDTPFEPASLTQSTARVYRQGQKHITKVIRPMQGQIESKIEAMVANKVIENAKALGKAMDSDAALYASIEREGDLKEFGPQDMLKLLGIKPAIYGGNVKEGGK